MLTAHNGVSRIAARLFGQHNQPAQTALGISLYEAKKLFIDAVTSGLVVTNAALYTVPPGTIVLWNWRFTFIREHLSGTPSYVAE